MSGLGVHIALTEDVARRLLEAGDNDGVLAVLDGIEDPGEWVAESQGMWDAMHRSLSNGTLFYDEGEYPLNRTVLGGKHLVDGDDQVVAYVSPKEVQDVARALGPVTEEELRKRYDAIDPDDYDGEHGPEDFKNTWDRFLAVRDLYKKAAASGRAVVFTVDQ